MPKGFHNSNAYNSNGEKIHWKGYKRCETFGALELQVIQKLNGFLSKHKFLHEFRVKGKTSKGSKTVGFRFWLDFYLPIKRIDLESDPSFHQRYELVRNRDIRRDKLLKQNLHIETIRIGELDLTEDGIKELMRKIDSIPDSTEILDHWM